MFCFYVSKCFLSILLIVQIKCNKNIAEGVILGVWVVVVVWKALWIITHCISIDTNQLISILSHQNELTVFAVILREAWLFGNQLHISVVDYLHF